MKRYIVQMSISTGWVNIETHEHLEESNRRAYKLKNENRDTTYRILAKYDDEVIPITFPTIKFDPEPMYREILDSSFDSSYRRQYENTVQRFTDMEVLFKERGESIIRLKERIKKLRGVIVRSRMMLHNAENEI